MTDTKRFEDLAIQRGNDLYTLDVLEQANGSPWGLISVFRGFQANAGPFKGETLKELRGISASQMESEHSHPTERA